MQRREVLAGATGVLGLGGGCVSALRGVPYRLDRPHLAARYRRAGVWETVGKRATRTAVTDSRPPTENVGPAWLRTPARPGTDTTPPVIGDRYAFVAFRDVSNVPEEDEPPVRLAAYDARDGTEAFETTLGTGVPVDVTLGSSVAFVTTWTDRRRAPSVPSEVSAVEPEDGTIRWTRSIPRATGPPALLDDTLWVPATATDGTLVTLTADGQTDRVELGYSAATGVAADASLLVVGTAEGTVVAIDPSTRELLWSTPLETGGEDTEGLGLPVIGSERIYFTTARALVALGRATGARQWRRTLLPESTGAPLAPPVVADGTIYQNRPGESVVGLDAKTGATTWRSDKPGGFNQAVVGADLLLYAASNVVHAYERDGGHRWSFTIPERDRGLAGFSLSPSLAVAHDLVYLSLSESRFYALGGAE